MTAPLVVALGTHALSERGWPSFAEDPESAMERAARSIAFVATRRPVVVAHCLEVSMTERLRSALEAALDRPVSATDAPTVIDRPTEAIEPGALDATRPNGAGVLLCAIGEGTDCTDEAASDLAVALDAEMLVLLADSPVVRDGPATDESSRAIRTISPDALGVVQVDDDHAATMEAAGRFVDTTGRVAAVGSIDHLEAMVAGAGGTRVRDGDEGAISFYGPPAGST